jgi:hypothetical protein
MAEETGKRELEELRKGVRSPEVLSPVSCRHSEAALYYGAAKLRCGAESAWRINKNRQNRQIDTHHGVSRNHRQVQEM